MTASPTDHLFRRYPTGPGTTGRGGTRGVGVVPGMCGWLGRCNRPQADHVSAAEWRARRELPAGAR